MATYSLLFDDDVYKHGYKDSLNDFEKTFTVLTDALESQKIPGELESLHNLDEINVIVVNDSDILQLNTEYRQKSMPTDVLTFHYPASFSGDIDTVEIYISIETAARQAISHGNQLSAELALLFAHGLVHAAGIDHERSTEEEISTRKLEHYLLSLTQYQNTKPLTEYTFHGAT